MLLIAISHGTNSVNGNCYSYDVCNRREVAFDEYSEQNCPDDQPGRPLQDAEAIEILKRRCGHFYKDETTPVCCTDHQAKTMEKNIQMAEGIFGRCQTCLRNMLKSICGVGCDPEQSDYITILENGTNPIDNKIFANVIEFRMNPKYMDDSYESCRHIIHPASGKLAMDLSCATEAINCDVEKWYAFQGEPSLNPLVPFRINYRPDDDANVSIQFYYVYSLT